MDRGKIVFIQSLTDDVQWALDHLQASDGPVERRNLLRTTVSAAEGMSWVYRMHVLSIAMEFDVATPLMEMAFAEASFSVSERGEIIEQPRHVSLPAMIRLTTKVAKSCCKEIDVDFGCAEWENLKRAIAARNRITHPKSNGDLILSDVEIGAAKSGFFWFFDMSIGVMEQTVRAFGKHVALAKEIVGDLIAGDPDTVALYERAHRELDD
ncbi:hypothetical protein [Sphingobium sp. ZW T5_29]|uniref:hypothetical protein n=1 Tax=Sphingobium sp. ZW T5_29 TaxID=3378077 RepID=UPI003853220A